MKKIIIFRTDRLGDYIIHSRPIYEIKQKYDDSYINCPDNSKIKMKVEVSTGNKCPRCWKIFNTLNASGLCNRCESVLDEKS